MAAVGVPERIFIMITETKTLILLCCECRTEINESAAFSFGGSFACESCVRKYYRAHPGNIELELRERRYLATQILRCPERMILEKKSAKQKAELPQVTGKWHGPFDTKQAAQSAGTATGRPFHWCSRC